MQLTGTYAVIFYAVSLFKDIGVSTNPYIPAIITGKTLLYVSYSFNVIYPAISSITSKPTISKGSIQLPEKKRKSAINPSLEKNPRINKAALEHGGSDYSERDSSVRWFFGLIKTLYRCPSVRISIHFFYTNKFFMGR
jgi:hypothetical protein